MSPWLAVTLFGLAVFGFAWISPRLREPEEGGDPAYDRLLEDLETENRELLEAITKFKDEQDATVKNLVKQIEELERQMKAVAEQTAFSSRNAAADAPQSGMASYAAALPPAQGSASAAAPASAATVQVPSQSASAQPAPADAQPAEQSRYAPPSIRDRYAALLAMHSKGKSIEQIAKSAGMNKGEVQLILQLAKREAEQLA
jgi:hypothetical protein